MCPQTKLSRPVKKPIMVGPRRFVGGFSQFSTLQNGILSQWRKVGGLSPVGDDLKRGLASVQNEIPLSLGNSPNHSRQLQPQLLGIDDLSFVVHVQLKITIFPSESMATTTGEECPTLNSASNTPAVPAFVRTWPEIAELASPARDCSSHSGGMDDGELHAELWTILRLIEAK
jgi:hypothetical protein